ncbi:MAG: c-type cytochrome [Chloroflexi bacterium]|nr:c-type cytochrome [Chloroflexota bacterium]
MELSAGGIVLLIALLFLLALLVIYASGVGRRSHEPSEPVPTGNPSMERKVVVSLGLMIISGLLLTGYSFVEPMRQAAATDRRQDIMIERGADTFTSLCITCHGVDGHGAVVPGTSPAVIAPALNRDDMHPTDPDAFKERYAYVVKTIHRGRGLIMPAWGRQDGGPLLDEQIEELATFITHGDKVVEGTQTAWQVARELSREKIAHGAPEPQVPTLDTAGLSPEEQAGSTLFAGKGGCIGCHTINGVGGQTGPDLSHIATVAATREPGKDAEAYISESIHTSTAFVVPGYPPVMPSFGGVLSEQEIKDLVAFLMTHK